MRVNTNPIEPEGDGPPVISRADADPSDVTFVLAGDPEAEDTRSQWQWFRLPNGDLILGTFPQGDTYFGVADRAGV